MRMVLIRCTLYKRQKATHKMFPKVRGGKVIFYRVDFTVITHILTHPFKNSFWETIRNSPVTHSTQKLFSSLKVTVVDSPSQLKITREAVSAYILPTENRQQSLLVTKITVFGIDKQTISESFTNIKFWKDLSKISSFSSAKFFVISSFSNMSISGLYFYISEHNSFQI